MQVKADSIKVDTRFRKTFGEIEALAASIERYGLLNPIIVDEELNLIAGERRLRAHQLLKKEMIEVKISKDLNELEKKEIELEENIQRKDFTWQEEVMAKKAIHHLKQELYGEGQHGTKVGWGLRETAQSLGESLGSVSMDIQLAVGMRVFPELMKETSKSAAYKKMKLKQEKILQEALAERLTERGALDHPDVINGSCLEVMGTMGVESVDLILTDPPYGIDLAGGKVHGRDGVGDIGFEDGDFETFDLLDKAFSLMYKVLKPGCHIYVFCAIDKFNTVIAIMQKHGFACHHMPLIWDKGSGSYPSQSTTYVHSYEPIIHGFKGERRKLNGTPRDVFPIKRVPSGKKIHPTEKPTELLRDLIEYSSLPGEIVFDPFAGSGSTLVAAKEKNRRAIGVEMNDVFYSKICERLKGGTDENVS